MLLMRESCQLRDVEIHTKRSFNTTPHLYDVLVAWRELNWSYLCACDATEKSSRHLPESIRPSNIILNRVRNMVNFETLTRRSFLAHFHDCYYPQLLLEACVRVFSMSLSVITVFLWRLSQPAILVLVTAGHSASVGYGSRHRHVQGYVKAYCLYRKRSFGIKTRLKFAQRLAHPIPYNGRSNLMINPSILIGTYR
jgi:hypothetical protein